MYIEQVHNEDPDLWLLSLYGEKKLDTIVWAFQALEPGQSRNGVYGSWHKWGTWHICRFQGSFPKEALAGDWISPLLQACGLPIATGSWHCPSTKSQAEDLREPGGIMDAADGRRTR